MGERYHGGTGSSHRPSHNDDAVRKRLDAGTHSDRIDPFTYSTSLLGPAVREKQLLSLEEAIHQLSDLPAG